VATIFAEDSGAGALVLALWANVKVSEVDRVGSRAHDHDADPRPGELDVLGITRHERGQEAGARALWIEAADPLEAFAHRGHAQRRQLVRVVRRDRGQANVRGKPRWQWPYLLGDLERAIARRRAGRGSRVRL
jgi:hypothetical protein